MREKEPYIDVLGDDIENEKDNFRIDQEKLQLRYI